MKSILVRSILISLAFMMAHAILSPFGLGWVVIVVFIAYLVFSIPRILRNNQPHPAATDSQDGPREDGQKSESGNLVGQLRARLDNIVKSGHLDDPAEDPKKKAQEADCDLTHQERAEFNRMIRRMGDAE